MNERAIQIQEIAARAAKLSSNAVSAMRAGDFNLSRTLLKDAVEAGRKCQILINENENSLKSSD